jgi:hypothetical protein
VKIQEVKGMQFPLYETCSGNFYCDCVGMSMFKSWYTEQQGLEIQDWQLVTNFVFSFDGLK